MIIASEFQRCVCELSGEQVSEFESFSLQYCIEKCCIEYGGVLYSFLEYSGSCDIAGTAELLGNDGGSADLSVLGIISSFSLVFEL